MATTTRQSIPPIRIPRRHDLDALRAIAMLLGIALHASLSFAPLPWIVQDARQSESFSILFSAIHGFRMPLFFLVSGFFTAMLWRKRGLKSLISHRFKRVFLPCMLGLITIIPLVNWTSGVAMKSQAEKTARARAAALNLWDASATGNVNAIQSLLADGANINSQQEDTGLTPLTIAAIADQSQSVASLLEHGADANAASADGSTPLHLAAFLGRDKIAEQLMAAGSDPLATNRKGETPIALLRIDWGITQFFAGILQIELDREELETGRTNIAAMLNDAGVAASTASASANEIENTIGSAIVLLFFYPVFHHLWFLWFLCWLVCGFAFYALIMDVAKVQRSPRWMTVSPLRYVWIIPLTLLPQSIMGLQMPSFGPDTSVGFLPLPHVLFYYAIFFGFGALYFDSHDDAVALGSGWRWTLPLSLLIVFPIGLAFSVGAPSFLASIVDEPLHRPLAVLLQTLFVWMMTFACMGMFRSLMHRENKTMRYISDSSYWLYVAHLPLVVALQWTVRDWPLPAWIKFLLVCATTSALLLLSYQGFVRYTWIGRMLNGPRQRPQPTIESPVVQAPVMGPQ